MPDSIQQPEPPEPDIIAEIEGQGRVAFELVRLNHEDEIVSMNLLAESSAFLAAEFAKMPEPRRSRLAAMYDDAHVLLQFSPTANPGQRKHALPFVWSILESQQAGVKGTLFNASIANQANASSYVHMVYAPGKPAVPSSARKARIFRIRSR